MSEWTLASGNGKPEPKGFAEVQICIGSSCHLKGSAEIVSRIRNLIEEKHLENDIILMGSFCTGRCNRDGVTILVDDDVFTGLTPEHFDEFFAQQILPRIGKELI